LVLLFLPLLATSGFAVGAPREADGFLVVPWVGAVLLLSLGGERGFSRRVQGGLVGLSIVLGALSQAQVGAWSEEETLWRWAHGRRPEDPQVRLNLARTVVESRPQEARDLLAGVGFGTPRHQREGEAVRAQAWLAVGNPGRAISHLQAASALDPEAAWATGTGCVLMAPGGRPGAVSQCRLALELLPEDADVQNAMGIVLATRGEVAEALGHFQAAVRLAPEQAVFQANLHRALSDLGGSGDEAGEGNSD
jgi:Flp pilus assembly protein TadD